MRKSELIIFGIIILSFATGIYYYPQMPEKVASHWNAQGLVNGYMSKFWGLFLMPIISVGMLLLFILIPRIDPLKSNIQQFRKYYDGFIVSIMVFLFYLYLLTIFWNSGYTFNMIIFLSPAFAILFYYSGILIENAKRNWFIGIRTPWTLSSDKVWDKTHKIGGKLFKIVGVVTLLAIFFESFAIFIIVVPVILISIYTVVYSYFEYQKEK
ncbi:MAG: SdpI family protein [Candidatus Methanoperedens sp.]|nr:SdpI family protein [Candidatus Methanoperedens sp.]MCZ7371504.1 SdpI family protein [Candidatus Methanoperedens sp.]